MNAFTKIFLTLLISTLGFGPDQTFAAKKSTDLQKPTAKLRGQLAKKKQIETAVAKARFCKERNECGGPIYHCAIGCAVFVNQEKLLPLKRMMATYPQTCEQKCPTVKDYDCIKGRCEAIF